MKFKAIVSKFKDGLWAFHIKIPDKVYKKMSKEGVKRIICQIDEYEPFHAGFMPEGNGKYFIMLSKAKLKAYDLFLGKDVNVKLEVDKTKYGMKMPEEFEEVLSSDSEGEKYFEELTDGKKRSLIHMVATIKSQDIKISKALTILDHLKANEGKVDYKLLNEAFKLSNRKY